MGFKYVWIFPLLLIIIPATFVITYFIAVSNKHVASIFPFISDTGALPPESCIFAQLLNIGALFGCVTVYLRHCQVCEVSASVLPLRTWLLRFSLIFMWVGYLSCLGISLVANFQEVNLSLVHFIGAMMAFCFGLFYGLGQTVLSYIVDRLIISIWVAHVRLLLSLISAALFVLMFANNFVDHPSKRVPLGKLPFISQNTNSTYTGPWYLVSAFSEWGFAATSILFFITFSAEFRHVTLHSPRVILNYACGSTKNTTANSTGTRTGSTDKLEKRRGAGKQTRKMSDPTIDAVAFTDYNKNRSTTPANMFPEIRIPRIKIPSPNQDKDQPVKNYRSFDETAGPELNYL